MNLNMNMNLDFLFKIESIQEIYDKDSKIGQVKKTVRHRNSKLSASMLS